MSEFEYIIVVALCAAAISYTITFAGIFKPIVDYMDNISEWLSELFHCPYCFGHYVILTIMLTTKDINKYLIHINDYILYNFLFTWFAIVCVMSLFHFLMTRAYIPVAENETFRKLQKRKQQSPKKGES